MIWKQLSGKLQLKTHSVPGSLTNSRISREMAGTLYDFLSFLNSFSFPLRSLKKFMEFFSIKKYQKDKL